jgi:phosphomannomutase
MVTASHNPARYNGLKFCREEAIPVGSASGLADVKAAVERGELVRAARRGSVTTRGAFEAYCDLVAGAAGGEVRPLKVALDAGNGVVGPFLERLLKPFPIDPVPLYWAPDGTFPNHEANPLKPENLRDLIAAVKRESCDLGAAFDGDGDRCAFVDENGGIVSGDMTTALLGRAILANELSERPASSAGREGGGSGGAALPPTKPRPPVVYDLRSSRAVREEIEKAGGTAVMERVGHAFIKATMRRVGALFAGEVSGHFYFRENFCAESAVIALVKMLAIVTRAGRPLSALVAEVDRYPRTGELNFHVEDKDGAIARLARVFADGKVSWLDGITVEYETWWFNVRKSNTEPLLRLNLEASTPGELERVKARVIDAIGTAPEAEGS